MRYKHRNKEFFADIQRKDITDYLQTFLTKRDGGIPLRIKTTLEADEAKRYLNNPKNTCSKSVRGMNTTTPYWYWQNVDFVSSNLGRGYIFYFICGACGVRVKYLYQYSVTKPPICRICCCLDYQRNKKTQKGRGISQYATSNVPEEKWEPRLTLTSNNVPCGKAYFV